MSTTQRNVIQYHGGGRTEPLVSVDEKEITVWVMKCQRKEVAALSLICSHIADAMGLDETSSPALVNLLWQAKPILTDAADLVVRMDRAKAAEGKEVGNVAQN